MTAPLPMPMMSEPRWEGRRLLFEIDDGERSATCAISTQALQDLSTRRKFKPAELLVCFAEVQPKIERIAFAKLRARAETSTSVLNIWADDVDDAAPSAHAGRPRGPHPARPA